MDKKKSQTERLYELLSEGFPVRTDQIVKTIYGEGNTLARVGARICDIKKKYGVDIEGYHDKENPALYWYKIKRENVIMSADDNSESQKSSLGNCQQVYPSERCELSRLL
jgi:hypothetical protein